MVKHAYAKGRGFEWEVMRFIRNGFPLVVRSAGSHGAVDVVAIRQGEAWLIQCKVDGSISPEERDELLKLSKLLSHPNGSFKALPLHAYKEGGKIVIKLLKSEPRHIKLEGDTLVSEY